MQGSARPSVVECRADPYRGMIPNGVYPEDFLLPVKTLEGFDFPFVTNRISSETSIRREPSLLPQRL